MSADSSFYHIKSYLAAYWTTKETAVRKTTNLPYTGCQNTLKARSSKHNHHADTFLKDSLSLILSPRQHEYYKRVINSLSQQDEVM